MRLFAIKMNIYILKTIKNATVIYVVFLIDCFTAIIVYVSNVLSFAKKKRLSKHLAQLQTPVGKCVEKWQNRHICHFDLLSTVRLPNCVINVLILSKAIRKQRETNKICLRERLQNS